MKRKLFIPAIVFSLSSVAASAQSGGNKGDTITPAKRIVSNKTGENNLPQRLKEQQLMERPVILKKDSANAGANISSKQKKSKYKKSRK